MRLEIIVQSHAAAFLGRSAWDLRYDAAAMIDAHRTAWSTYRQRTLFPGNDAQTLEAEVWGASVRAAPSGEAWHIESPILHALGDVPALPDLAIDSSAAPLSTALAAAAELGASTTAEILVPVTGPFTLASHLLGTEVLIRTLHDDPFGTREHLLTLARKLRPWIAAIAQRGAGIVICDRLPASSELEPDIFSGLVVPALAWMVNEATAQTRVRPVLAVEGEVSSIAYRLFSTNAGTVVCPAQARRSHFFAQAHEFPDTTVRLDLPSALWHGTDWHSICQEIAAARSAARHHPATVLGTGTLPFDASSVHVVDASHFTASLDEWMEV